MSTAVVASRRARTGGGGRALTGRVRAGAAAAGPGRARVGDGAAGPGADGGDGGPAPHPRPRARAQELAAEWGLDLAAVGASLPGGSLRRAGSAGGSIGWRVDPAAAAEEARATGRCHLLFYTATWWNAGTFEQDAFGVGEVAERLASAVIPVRRDVTNDVPALADRGLVAVPGVVLLDPGGTEVGRWIPDDGRDALRELVLRPCP